MSKGSGSLLVTVDGLETSHIPEEERDGAIIGFYEMKSEAERHDDRFYALTSIYRHAFSYGDFYPGFVNMSWSDFKAVKTLKGISQAAFEMMQGFCQIPDVKTLSDEVEFQKTKEPHAHTGYSNPQNIPDFVGNLTDWAVWHKNWIGQHPDDIDWSVASNALFPRPDEIIRILRREVILELGEEVSNRIKDSNLANVFHEEIMKHKGAEIHAYANKIGGEICSCNYYTYEAELSDMERQYAKSIRAVYSIVKENGSQQFISIDFGHGMFEFHNENGDHLGEFRFDGSLNSGIEENHALKCLEQWRRQKGNT